MKDIREGKGRCCVSIKEKSVSSFFFCKSTKEPYDRKNLSIKSWQNYTLKKLDG